MKEKDVILLKDIRASLALKKKNGEDLTLEPDVQKAYDKLIELERLEKATTISEGDLLHNASEFLDSISKSGNISGNESGILTAQKTVQENFIEQRKSVYNTDNTQQTTTKHGKLFIDDSVRRKAITQEQSLLQDYNDAFMFFKSLFSAMPSLKDTHGQKLTEIKECIGTITKTMHTTNTGYGLEYIPTAWSNKVFEVFNLERRLANLFESVPVYSKIMPVPVKNPNLMGYYLPEYTASAPYLEANQVSSADLNTAMVTFTMKSIAVKIPLSYEMFDYSIIDLMEYVRSCIVFGLINSQEHAILNGDDTIVNSVYSHIDYTPYQANPSSNGRGKSSDYLWKGLRKYAFDGSLTGDLTSINSETWLAMLANMGKYFFSPSTVSIVNDRTYLQLLGLKDGNGSLLKALDVQGTNGTILNGRIFGIYGIPLVMSEYMRSDLASTGKNTQAGPNTTTSIVTVCTDMFKTGLYMKNLLESARIVEAQALNFVGSSRMDFQPVVNPSSTNKTVYNAINVPLTF